MVFEWFSEPNLEFTGKEEDIQNLVGKNGEDKTGNLKKMSIVTKF